MVGWERTLYPSHSAGIYSGTVSCGWKNLADTVRPQVLFLGSVCSSPEVEKASHRNAQLA